MSRLVLWRALSRQAAGCGRLIETGFRAWCTAVMLAVVACGGGEEVVIKTADGVELTAADIDRNPLALMPAGAVGVFSLDAPALFQSSAGGRLLALTQARLPVPSAANFLPERDLTRIVLGLYSFQGVDFMGVATGQFDPAAIERVADGTQTTPLGSPLVRVEYAGRVFYVSANVGFVVLTPHTVVFGNETGIRRALDRIEAGRIAVEMAPELATLIERPGAPMAFGSDARNDPQVAATASQLAFLQGLTMMRAVGNFDAPGLNIAGTLTYADSAAAERGGASLQQLKQNLSTVGFLASMLGLVQPVQRLETTVVESSLQVMLAVDGAAAAQLLDQLAAFVGAGGSGSQAAVP